MTWAGRDGVTKASKADTEHAAMASDDVLPPRVSLELFARRRSDFVFFGLTELSGCRPVSVAARNLSTVNGQLRLSDYIFSLVFLFVLTG